jgi:prophage regulatory protein
MSSPRPVHTVRESRRKNNLSKSIDRCAGKPEGAVPLFFYATLRSRDPDLSISPIPRFQSLAIEKCRSIAMPKSDPVTHTRTIRRQQLKEMVPLADSTIFGMEQRGEFPRRFALSSRCVVWDLAEVEAWLALRRARPIARGQQVDVRHRRSRPVRG